MIHCFFSRIFHGCIVYVVCRSMSKFIMQRLGEYPHALITCYLWVDDEYGFYAWLHSLCTFCGEFGMGCPCTKFLRGCPGTGLHAQRELREMGFIEGRCHHNGYFKRGAKSIVFIITRCCTCYKIRDRAPSFHDYRAEQRYVPENQGRKRKSQCEFMYQCDDCR